MVFVRLFVFFSFCARARKRGNIVAETFYAMFPQQYFLVCGGFYIDGVVGRSRPV